MERGSLWKPSKIPAAFETTSDRQAQYLATCPWSSLVAQWKQSQLHSLSFSLAPSIPCCYPKMNSHLQHNETRKKYGCAFNTQHILYVRFVVGIFTLNHQLKFTWQMNRQYVLQPAQSVCHFNFSQILLTLFLLLFHSLSRRKWSILRQRPAERSRLVNFLVLQHW